MKRLFEMIRRIGLISLIGPISLCPCIALASGASSAPFNPSAVNITGGTISGSVSYPPPFSLASIRGSTAVSITGSTFSSSNVTLTGGCSISSGTVVCGTSAGTFYPISWTPTSGTMYQVDLVPSAVTSTGAYYLTMGGVTVYGAGFTPTAGQTYRAYILAGSAAALTINSVGGAGTSLTFSSLTVKPVQNPSIIWDTDTGQTAQLDISLPDATAGYVYQHLKQTAYASVLKSRNGTDGFLMPGNATPYTTSLTTGTVFGTWVDLKAIAAGSWFVTNSGLLTPQ